MIAKGRGSSLPIREHLDGFDDVLRRFFSRGVVQMIDLLTLERPEDTFDASAIPAVACAAQAGDKAVPIESALVARVDLPSFFTPRPTKLTPVHSGAGCDGG